jgi:hypothetical protein
VGDNLHGLPRGRADCRFAESGRHIPQHLGGAIDERGRELPYLRPSEVAGGGRIRGLRSGHGAV